MLIRIRSKSAKAVLERALKNKSLSVDRHERIALALAHYGAEGSAALPYLSQRISVDFKRVKTHISALGMLNTPVAIAVLQNSFAAQANLDVQLETYNALLGRGVESMAPMFRSLIDQIRKNKE